MSDYTTELRFICETLSGLTESVGYDEVDNVISKARPKIFSFDYPIFDTAYKAGLEEKIIRHFYTREICEETYGLWKLRLEAKMNEIMPLYNQLYESERLEFNPLYDADYHKDGTGSDTRDREREGTTGRTTTNSGTDTRSNTTFGTSALSGKDVVSTDSERTESSETHSRDKYSEWDLYSDTPQGGIAGITGAEDPPSLEDNGYLTNARHILHDGDGTEASGESTTTEDTDKTTAYGKKDTRHGTETETMLHGKKQVVSGTDAQTINEVGSNQFAHHTYGRLGGRTPAELLLEYRKTFLNIDMLIIEELESLFFGLW